MRIINLAPALALCLAMSPITSAKDGKWIKMFNGKDLTGWKASELPENWKVENGTIVAQGARSHLFFMTQECVDCEFEAQVKTTKGSNSGMYFRAEFLNEGFPKGYEAQVNNSHTDPKRTGSLYNFKNVMEHLVDDDVWFTQNIRAVGNHIVIKVNGKIVVDHIEDKNTYTKGYLALQAHDPKSVTYYRNLRMRVITPDKK